MQYGLFDDAYISLRYARNLVEGEGLVYNPGEWVEGYTNLAWTLMLALGMALGTEGPALARWGGTVFAGLVAITIWFFHLRLQRGEEGSPWVLLSPLLWAAAPMTWVHSASGLETMAYTWLVLVHALLLVGGPQRSPLSTGNAMLSGLALALAAATRPEAMGLFVVGTCALLLGRAMGLLPCRPQALVGFTLSFVLPMAATLAWRQTTYGQWVPNTFFAKVGGGSAGLLQGGLEYAAGAALVSFAAIALPLLGGRKWREQDGRLAYLGVLLTAMLAATALVGGDHMPMWRFAVPMLPIGAILLVQGVAGLPTARLGREVRIGVVLLLTMSVGSWQALTVRLHGATEHDRAQMEAELARTWSDFGSWLATRSKPQDSIALVSIGAVGYTSRLLIMDQVGLVDAHIAHLDIDPAGEMVGHNKFDNDYILDRKPTFILASHLVRARGPVPVEGYLKAPFHQVHKDLVNRPALLEAYEYRCEPSEDGGYYLFFERRL